MVTSMMSMSLENLKTPTSLALQLSHWLEKTFRKVLHYSHVHTFFNLNAFFINLLYVLTSRLLFLSTSVLKKYSVN